MFYAYVIVCVLVSIAAGLLLPFWAFGIYLVALFALIGALPSLLAKMVDPRNAEIIRVYCQGIGISEVTVRPFPNHYGVRFRADDRRFHARCTVAGGKLRWKGKSPQDLINARLDT